MPIPAEERQLWLDHLHDNPLETAASVAAVVTNDLEHLADNEHLRIGTRVLTDVAARSYIQSLLTSVDHVEVAALAGQYIQMGQVEADGEGLIGINVDN